MKLFILDTGGGVGVDFAFRCQLAGHEVRMFSNSKRHPNSGKGIVHRVSNWEDHMKWADMIFMTDNTKYQAELGWYFKRGFPIFGTNPESARLELDREYGQEVMEACGIPCPPYQIFRDYKEAEAYVLKCNERFVSKPCDDEDKSLSYVAKNPADLVYMLRRWAKVGKKNPTLMLQKFIPGVEMGVSGWFGPNGWCSVWEENFEHKKLMNDDKGVNTGEMGTAIKYVRQSKLAEMVLEPLTPALQALGFVGNCDINVIIDEEGTPWPLEFTVRPGWPSFYIQSALHKGDPCEWMAALLQGEDRLKVSFNHAIGVVLAIPDFPYSHATGKEVEGTPIYGLNAGNIDKVRLGEVMVGSAPCMCDGKIKDQEMFVSAGDYLACVVGQGTTVEKARHDCYGTIDELEVPNNLMYRTDIGKRLKKQIPILQKMGFAEEWNYGED